MSDDMPKQSTKLTEVLKTLDQPQAVEALAIMSDGQKRSEKFGAMALMTMATHEGMVKEFANWATHPLNGLMYRDPSVHPLPEKIAEVLCKLTGDLNEAMTGKREAPAPKPKARPLSHDESRRAFMKEVGKYFAVYTGLSGAGFSYASVETEKNPDKKLQAGTVGFLLGMGFGTVPSLISATFHASVLAPMRKKAFADLEAERASVSPIDMQDLVKYTYQTLEKIHSQAQAVGKA